MLRQPDAIKETRIRLGELCAALDEGLFALARDSGAWIQEKGKRVDAVTASEPVAHCSED